MKWKEGLKNSKTIVWLDILLKLEKSSVPENSRGQKSHISPWNVKKRYLIIFYHNPRIQGPNEFSHNSPYYPILTPILSQWDPGLPGTESPNYPLFEGTPHSARFVTPTSGLAPSNPFILPLLFSFFPSFNFFKMDRIKIFLGSNFSGSL